MIVHAPLTVWLCSKDSKEVIAKIAFATAGNNFIIIVKITKDLNIF